MALPAFFRDRRWQSVRVALLAGLLAGLAMLVPGIAEWFHDQDRKLADRWLRMPGGPAERSDLVFLGIDDSSLTLSGVDPQAVAADGTLAMMAARFPWDRRVYAAAIEKLARAGARLIVLDVVFSEPADPAGDEALAETIARHRDRVLLASMFAPATEEVVTLVEPVDGFLGDDEPFTATGFVNFRPDDRDGLVREAIYSTTLSAQNHSPGFPGEPVFGSLAAGIISALGKEPPAGTREMRFGVKDRRDLATALYRPVPFRGLFIEDDWVHRFGSGAWFRDKVVMIGPAAPRFHDSQATPAGLLLGPQLHLQAAACGMGSAFVLGSGMDALWIQACAGAVLAAAWTWIIRRPVLALAGAVVLAGGIFAASGWLMAARELMIGVYGVVIVFGFGVVASQTFELVGERLERGRLQREFRRFVSRDVADTLVREPGIYKAAARGKKRQLVVLFSDVRNFATFSERVEPVMLVNRLNEYLTAMVDVVFAHSGTLDKFIGDAVMVHWGALAEGDPASQAAQAIRAARGMTARLAELNEHWHSRDLEPMRMGIGVHFGEAVAGEIGSPERIEFGVIGDAVNLASRIEGLTRYFECDILFSGTVVEVAGGDHGLRRIARVRVKGRRGPVDVWTDAVPEPAAGIYAAALDAFERGDFDAAAAGFGEAAVLCPDDGPTGRMARWAREFAADYPPGWDGVIIMTDK